MAIIYHIIIVIFIFNLYNITPYSINNKNNNDINLYEATKGESLDKCSGDSYLMAYTAPGSSITQFHYGKVGSSNNQEISRFIESSNVYFYNSTPQASGNKKDETIHTYLSTPQKPVGKTQTLKLQLLSRMFSDGTKKEKEIICDHKLNWGNCDDKINITIGLTTAKSESSENAGDAVPSQYVDECGITTKHDDKTSEFSALKTDNDFHYYKYISTDAKPLTKTNIKELRMSKIDGNTFYTTIFNDQSTQYCHINNINSIHTIIIGVIPANVVDAATATTPISIKATVDILVFNETEKNKLKQICPTTAGKSLHSSNKLKEDICINYNSFTIETNLKNYNIYINELFIGSNNTNIIIISSELVNSLENKYLWCFTGMSIGDGLSLNKINIFIIISIILLLII